MTFDTVLVANRGEIARRVLATCRDRGLRTVAVHSAVDADAAHVGEADVAVALAGEPVAAYLDVDAIVAAAVEVGADAIHPGYGFLSENPALPRACEAAGITFVGPSAEVIALMGDKARAKEVAGNAGVPTLTSVDPTAMEPAALRAAVGDLGLPVLVKAVAGGGGKGMRRVDDLDDLDDAIAAAAREGAAAFGDDRLLVERFVTAPRHVEVQVAGDAHGGAVHLFERDCSVQRRHQKVVEEAPSPALDPALRERMGAAAVALVAQVGYVNLGTVEFLLDTAGDGTDFFFLEMNTRLQVEHPVTEYITGLDLVGCQLDIAAGGTVPTPPRHPRGHAIEVRLYAEDVAAGFLPQSGVLDRFAVPGAPFAPGDGVRVDAGVAPGATVSPHYDPMLAKVIAHGSDREQARERLLATLRAARVTGIVTNLGHLLDVLDHPAFATGDVTTAFLDDHLPDWQPTDLPDALVAGVAATLAATSTATAMAGPIDRRDPWARLGPWRLRGSGGWHLSLEGRDWEVATTGTGWTVRHGDETLAVAHLAGPDDDGACRIRVGDDVGSKAGSEVGSDEFILTAERDADHVWVTGPAVGSRRLAAPRTLRHLAGAAVAGAATLTAPMPGQVVAVAVAVDDVVAAGDVLVLVEAMKMEHPVRAPSDGVVTALEVRAGDAVGADQVLVGFRPADAEDPTDTYTTTTAATDEEARDGA